LKKNNMRVIFMGTPEFAVVSLNKLLQNNIHVITVVTVPDKPRGRGLKLQPSAVKTAALKANLTVLQPESLKDDRFIQSLHALKPDLIVVVAFRILPQEVFTIPPLGTVNLHGSLLPAYRGAAPISWAIINGEKITGATTFFINKEIDTGNIIDQVEIPITPGMTAGELHDIMAIKGAELLVASCRKIEKGSVTTIAQDTSLASRAPKIHREQCKINFHQPVEKVHNFIRGLSPYPSAYSFMSGKRLFLFNSSIVDSEKIEANAGTIITIPDNDKIVVQCIPGMIALREVQLEGKRRMSVADFLRGHKLTAGFLLGE
jgi:methionyl-tRNA formyltransferase